MKLANKTEVVEVAQGKLEELGIKISKKDMGTHVDVILDSIKDVTVEHGKVQLAGFGNFEVRKRAARTGRNPQNGEPIQIAETKVPAFKPLKDFKDAVKK